MVSREEDPVEVSAAQFRAARAFLGWSLLHAAKTAAVSVSVLMKSESPAELPGVVNAARTIRAAYEAAGITFLKADASGHGVRMNHTEA